MQHHKVFIRLWFNIKQKLLIGLATFIRLYQWIDIRYFLEFVIGFYNDDEPWTDYGVLVLYTFKNNYRILVDLANDVYTQDVKKHDELVKSVDITEQVEKEKLVKFCDDYWYSNGYNSKERFKRVLDDNYEGGLIKEVDRVTNQYDNLLGNY